MSKEHSVMKTVAVMLERGDVVMLRAAPFRNLHANGAGSVRVASAAIEITGGGETAPINGESISAQLDQRSKPVPSVFPVAVSSGISPTTVLRMLLKAYDNTEKKLSPAAEVQEMAAMIASDQIYDTRVPLQ
eukprot:IDg2723t1